MSKTIFHVLVYMYDKERSNLLTMYVLVFLQYVSDLNKYCREFISTFSISKYCSNVHVGTGQVTQWHLMTLFINTSLT